MRLTTCLKKNVWAVDTQHFASLTRYLKQVKQRNTAPLYGAAHVCLLRMEKTLSFLNFKLEDYDNEQFHLQRANETLSAEVKNRIPELARQGLSVRQMADHLLIGSTTVQRELARLKKEYS